MTKFDLRTPTYIMESLVHEAMTLCGPMTGLQARKLIKRALASDAVRAAILEHVEEALVDAATERITDTHVRTKN